MGKDFAESKILILENRKPFLILNFPVMKVNLNVHVTK